MWDNIPGTHQSIAENAMRIESERKARELEAATIAGFIGGLIVVKSIMQKEEWRLPEGPFDFLEAIVDEINCLLCDPVSVKDKNYFNG